MDGVEESEGEPEREGAGLTDGKLTGTSLAEPEGDRLGVWFEIGCSLMDGAEGSEGEPGEEGAGSTDGELTGAAVVRTEGE
jgi:hypothetical protein